MLIDNTLVFAGAGTGWLRLRDRFFFQGEIDWNGVGNPYG